MAGQVTLKQIAERCGVAVSTASLILNRRTTHYSSATTCKRVRDTAEEMGYKVNFGYRLMRGQNTRTVAIITSMPHMKGEEYIRELIVNLIGDFDRRGYASYFTPLGNDGTHNLDKIREFLARGVEHFIFLGSPVGYAEMETAIEAAGRLLLSTSHLFKRRIVVDGVSGVAQVMRFLAERGGDGFRVLGPGAALAPETPRILALQMVFPGLSHAELDRRFLRKIENFSYEADGFSDAAFQAGYDGARALLEREPEVRALMCLSDPFALGAAIFLHESGRKIGRDVLLGGCNNDFAVRHSPFPISTVDLSWRKYSSLLVEHALQSGTCDITLTPQVIFRENIETSGVDHHA